MIGGRDLVHPPSAARDFRDFGARDLSRTGPWWLSAGDRPAGRRYLSCAMLRPAGRSRSGRRINSRPIESDGKGSRGSPGGVVDCDGLGDELGLLDFAELALLWALGLLEAVFLPPPVVPVVLCWLLPGAVVPPAEPLARAVAGGAATDPGRVEAGCDVGEWSEAGVPFSAPVSSQAIPAPARTVAPAASAAARRRRTRNDRSAPGGDGAGRSSR